MSPTGAGSLTKLSILWQSFRIKRIVHLLTLFTLFLDLRPVPRDSLGMAFATRSKVNKAIKDRTVLDSVHEANIVVCRGSD
jgi:hypothetical protein